jgi:hypothetical protein
MTAQKEARVVSAGEYRTSTHRFYAPPSWDSIEARAIAFADLRWRVEAELVGAILADAIVGVAAAQDVGLRPDHFGHDDLRLIFRAAVFSAEKGRRDAIPASEFLLRKFHLWDDRQIVGNVGVGCRWSRRALEGLAARHFPCPPLVKLLAGKVIDLKCAESMVREYLHLARAALEEELTPSAWHLHLSGEPAENYRAKERAT